MSVPNPTERKIAPHGLAHDGFRWNTRAWCARDGLFKDFVLGRILTCYMDCASEVDPSEDRQWVETVTLRIAVHPGLSENQRRGVELDYGMNDGVAEVAVRKSLLFYNLKQLGLDTTPDARPPQDQHIVLRNMPEIQDALGQRTA